MRRCVLCGDAQRTNPLVISAQARLGIEEQFLGRDVDTQLAEAGICNLCLTLPPKMRDRLLDQRLRPARPYKLISVGIGAPRKENFSRR